MKRSNSFAENRRIAGIVLALCVLFAVVGLGPTKLNGLREDALRVFRVGADENASYVVSVKGDLIVAAENAGKLASSAAVAFGEKDDGVVQLKALSAEILENQNDPDRMLSAFWQLVSQADQLYVRMEAEMKGQDALREPAAQIRTILSASSTIPKDAYFKYVDKFNKAREGFPATVLAWIGDIDALDTGK